MFVASLEKILISNYPGADLQPYGCFIIITSMPQRPVFCTKTKMANVPKDILKV